MQLFFAPELNPQLKEYVLDELESRHCVKVLRMKTGDILHLTDGRGHLYVGRLTDDHIKKCRVEIEEVQQEQDKRDFHLHIAVAPTKNINRFEWFLEKATEIGIDEITPLLCEHSERKHIKPDRLERILSGAMKQSLKTCLPKLNPMVKLNEFVSQDFSGQKFIAYVEKHQPDSLQNWYKQKGDVLILIGPEGDFSPGEVQLAMDHGFEPINLGPNRLRTETAALIACHTINLINE
ncbi:MAG: 16S rRNA (uracil(1498)-N(3))-methyltransferase [Bacteroidales bacterium]|nr:16S rRNA (uracil(1498)-N(3))-methyltransferase [Bacteroidales bacterium]